MASKATSPTPSLACGSPGIEFAGIDLSAPVASAVEPQPILAGRPCGDHGLTVLNWTELVMSLTAAAMRPVMPAHGRHQTDRRG
jgi:hypothetical protein